MKSFHLSLLYSFLQFFIHPSLFTFLYSYLLLFYSALSVSVCLFSSLVSLQLKLKKKHLMKNWTQTLTKIQVSVSLNAAVRWFSWFSPRLKKDTSSSSCSRFVSDVFKSCLFVLHLCKNVFDPRDVSAEAAGLCL